MDGNPEGTPNPLNPVQGVGDTNNDPQPNTETATETETLEYIESDSPTGTQTVSAVDESITATPATPAEPTSSAMPQMATPAPRPARPSGSVVDPMMRPVSHAGSAPQAATSGADGGFGSFATDGGQPDQLAQDIEQVSVSENLVASDSIVEPVAGDKKKKGLIIGAVSFILIAVICGGVAIAIAMMNNGDRLTSAIDKLLGGQVSSIIGVKGTISSINGSADYDDDESASTSISIDFDGTFDTASTMNEVEASINAEMYGTEITLDVNELTNKTGDTYFKVSGVDNLLKSASPLLSAATGTLGSSSSSLTTAMNSVYSKIVDQVEDKWILASGDTSELTDGLVSFDNTSLCVAKAFSEDLPKYGKDLAEKYKANPFITSSKDNLAISKKKNELYKLGYDKEKMNAFGESVSNNGFIKAINTCMGGEDKSSSSTISAIDSLDSFPTIYVEIDNNSNFTRIYADMTVEAGGVSNTSKLDMNITYPSELKIVEPDDYTDLKTVITNVLSAVMYSDSTNVNVETVTE